MAPSVDALYRNDKERSSLDDTVSGMHSKIELRQLNGRGHAQGCMTSPLHMLAMVLLGPDQRAAFHHLSPAGTFSVSRWNLAHSLPAVMDRWNRPALQHTRRPLMQEVVSPFAEDSGKGDDGSAGKESGSDASQSDDGPLELNLENVELVLDKLRPYLMADGGNVAVSSIEGGVVKLELQGACSTCTSSIMTMKMGLEKGLRERIPEILSVEQVQPEGPELTEDGIEGVLEEIRPFIKMAGGSVDLVELTPGGVQPTARLSITGPGATVNSVRVEIVARLKRKFPSLANVVWD